MKLGAELNELEKLDISKSPVKTFETKTELKNLAYFIAFETKFKQLNLAHMSRIKYLIAPNSGISEIDWKVVNSLSRIESIELPELYDSQDDALNDILRNKTKDFQNRINIYLTRILNEKYITLNRIKILLLGNTTAGKSTLRRILFSQTDEEENAACIEEESTHGVIIENRVRNISSEEVNIQLFDFGGQDYYHATHLPFYQKDTLHWIIYKSEYPKISSAYSYGIKKAGEREEIIFPITYWLNSLKTIRKIGDLSPTVDIIQNLHNNIYPKYELNNFEIKNMHFLRVENLIEYNFKEDAKIFKKWLLDRINNQFYFRNILTNDFELSKNLQVADRVVFSIEDIYNLTNKHISKESIIQSLESLHSNFLGHWVELKYSPKYGQLWVKGKFIYET